MFLKPLFESFVAFGAAVVGNGSAQVLLGKKPLREWRVGDEAETVLHASVENGRLVLKRRPDTSLALEPLYADAFLAPQLGTVIFRRDANGRITALSVSEDRVWDLRFERR